MEEVDHAQVDEFVSAVEGECDGGAEGAQPQDVEWQVHADDGVCMAQPNGEGGVSGDVVEVKDEGLAWLEVRDGGEAQVFWFAGGVDQGDGASGYEITPSNAVRGDCSSGVKGCLWREGLTPSVGRDSTVGFDVEGDDACASHGAGLMLLDQGMKVLMI